MKRTVTLIFLVTIISFVSGFKAQAQQVPEGYVLVDSVVYRPVATVDTTLVGKDIFLLMPTREMGAGAEVP